jgi:hypothetical protein
MKNWLWIAMLLMFFACGNNPGEQEGSAETVAGMVGDTGFAPEVMTYIQTITDLDCKIYTVISNAALENESGKYVDEIRVLRKEKQAVIDKILAINSDSTFVGAVREAVHKLGISDQFCPELNAPENGKASNGIPAESRNIREDAGKLAELNCRIMTAYKQVESNPANDQDKKALQSLLNQKHQFFMQLVQRYGKVIIKDEFFRKMLMEAQNEQCDYMNELRAAGRINSNSL